MNFLKVKCIRNFDGSAYLTRVNLLEIGRLSIKFHVFNSSDDARTTSFHNHPFYFFGIILSKPGYIEHNEKGTFHRKQGYIQWQKPNYSHRIELYKYEKDDPDAQGSKEKPVLTLFCTWKADTSWGFHCPKGHMNYKEFHKNGGCL